MSPLGASGVMVGIGHGPPLEEQVEVPIENLAKAFQEMLNISYQEALALVRGEAVIS